MRCREERKLAGRGKEGKNWNDYWVLNVEEWEGPGNAK